MLVRERIDPHFNTAPSILSQGEERRAGGPGPIGRRQDLTAALPVPLGRGPVGSLRSRKRDAVAALAALAVAAAIATNALVLQNGPHPAPIFAIRPRPVVREATGAVAQLPRPRASEAAKPDLPRRVDGIPLPRPRPQSRQAADAHPDPIADILNPARGVKAVP